MTSVLRASACRPLTPRPWCPRPRTGSKGVSRQLFCPVLITAQVSVVTTFKSVASGRESEGFILWKQIGISWPSPFPVAASVALRVSPSCLTALAWCGQPCPSSTCTRNTAPGLCAQTGPLHSSNKSGWFPAEGLPLGSPLPQPDAHPPPPPPPWSPPPAGHSSGAFPREGTFLSHRPLSLQLLSLFPGLPAAVWHRMGLRPPSLSCARAHGSCSAAAGPAVPASLRMLVPMSPGPPRGCECLWQVWASRVKRSGCFPERQHRPGTDGSAFAPDVPGSLQVPTSSPAFRRLAYVRIGVIAVPAGGHRGHGGSDVPLADQVGPLFAACWLCTYPFGRNVCSRLLCFSYLDRLFPWYSVSRTLYSARKSLVR